MRFIDFAEASVSGINAIFRMSVVIMIATPQLPTQLCAQVMRVMRSLLAQPKKP